MLIQTEPADLLMVRYKLYFNQHSPDPEDAWVLTYLQEHGLEPRRQLAETHGDVPYTVLHFGQCYLGRHLEAISTLYRRGIEHTALAEHIQHVLSEADATALQVVAADLAAQLHAQARFEVTAEGNMQVSIDTAAVTAAWQALGQSSSAVPEGKRGGT
jgi:hypothetical protein